MKNKDRFIIIMAGGRGERFWPVSRNKTPKQLLKLLGDQSFLQQTVERVLPLTSLDNIFIITNEMQTAEVRKQLPDLPRINIITEPCGRDTCAAITLGAALAYQRNPNAILAVLPADHIINKEEVFQKTLTDCFNLASNQDLLVTIGIKPTEPATGYGYIKTGESLNIKGMSASTCTEFNKVDRFVEKPNLPKAQQFLKSDRYRWNAGMFVWSLSSFLNALERYQPEMAQTCRNWIQVASNKARLKQILKIQYPDIARISIDYALMEKADNVVMAHGNFDWDDLGSWTALEKYLMTDSNGNRIRGTCVQVDSHRNIVFDSRKKTGMPIALLGINDSIVVQTDDACLIATKSCGQKLKELVSLLSNNPKFKRVI